MAELKAVVIGCGGHAQSHLRMIDKEPRLRLVGVAELNDERREQAEAEWQVEGFADYRSMLDSCQPDLVVVATMPGHLKAIVIDCLERGLHTSVEKAPGMNADETRAMAVAASNSKGKAMVSFNRRYFPQVLALRQLVEERGGAVHCAATYNKPLTPPMGTPAWDGIAPDPLICDAIHHVDLLRWLAGRGTRAALAVEVHAQVHDGASTGAHRHSALVHFDTGVHGVLMSHYGVGGRIQRAEVHADNFSGYLELTGSPPVAELYQAKGERGRAVDSPPLDLETVGGADFDETRHFVDCILADEDPWSTLDDAVQTMRLCQAIRAGHRGPLTSE